MNRIRFLALFALGALLAGCSDDSSDAGGQAGGGAAAGTAGVAGAAGAGGSAGEMQTLGPILVSEEAKSIAEAEPHVAVTSAGRVGVAWIGREGTRNVIGYRLSEDRGESWGAIQVIEPAVDFSSGDPTLAAHPNGDLWIGWGTVKRDAQGNRIEGHLFVARAAPGEPSFGTPIEITDPSEEVLYDQPRLHIRGDGRILASYMKYPKLGYESAIVVASSSDGQSFVRTLVAGGPGTRNFAFLCSGPESQRVWIRYLDMSKGVVLGWSDDGGLEFPPANRSQVQGDDETSSIGMSTPGCVASGQDLWILYGIDAGVTNYGDNEIFTRVRLAHSSDAGVTIASRVDVQDPESGALYMFPEIVRESSGAIDIAYYAGDAAGDPQASFRTARTTDLQTFPPSLTIGSPLTLMANRSSPAWLGDYVGLAFESGQLYAVYTDNASGYGHTAFWRGTLPAP